MYSTTKTIDSLFENAFFNNRYESGSMRVKTIEGETTIYIDAPGFTKSDIKCEIEDSVLNVSGSTNAYGRNLTLQKSLDIKNLKDASVIVENGVIIIKPVLSTVKKTIEIL